MQEKLENSFILTKKNSFCEKIGNQINRNAVLVKEKYILFGNQIKFCAIQVLT